LFVFLLAVFKAKQLVHGDADQFPELAAFFFRQARSPAISSFEKRTVLFISASISCFVAHCSAS
jgi:hypothetical protein